VEYRGGTVLADSRRCGRERWRWVVGRPERGGGAAHTDLGAGARKREAGPGSQLYVGERGRAGRARCFFPKSHIFRPLLERT
jgi:hypothetical protein